MWKSISNVKLFILLNSIESDRKIYISQKCCWLLDVLCLSYAAFTVKNDKVIWLGIVVYYIHVIPSAMILRILQLVFTSFSLHSLSLIRLLLDRFDQRWQRQAGSR